MKPLVSVIVPAYNEASVLEAFHARAGAVFERLDSYRWELLFVNDGSRDATQSVIDRLCARDPRVGSVQLSRNFGKEIAMTAGLDHARGDAVVVIDADLQDPPELMEEFLAHWRDGFDVVYATRIERIGETWAKKASANLFYRLMGRVSQVDIPRNTGDYRLMSRRAVDALLRLREQHRFMKGLFAWIGFPSRSVEYRREPRASGNTKFNYWKLWNFAVEGITSFTTAPLKMATYFGFIVALIAFAFGVWIIAKTLLWGDTVRGYPSLMVTLLFFGGVQLFCIGVLGEYLGRIFVETKGRPLYLVQDYQPARAERGDAAADQAAARPSALEVS
ncbi:MAG: glycosyltransferase [Ramlibacter sp.]|nr:glycosyltransferase [Ramlibacter sp.]